MKKAKRQVKKPAKKAKPLALDEGLNSLSHQQLKELVMITTYKLAMTRAQIEALTEILIKNKLTTYEEIWKLTHESFKDSKV